MAKVKKSFFERLTGSKKIEPIEYTNENRITPLNNLYEEETAIFTEPSSLKNDMTEENSSLGLIKIPLKRLVATLILKILFFGEPRKFDLPSPMREVIPKLSTESLDISGLTIL
jgi:hypothetical protein